MLRAVQKGNAASLITSLSVDAAALYRAAAAAAADAVTARADAVAPLPKLGLYCEYRAAVLDTYSYCFAGAEP